MKKSMKSAAAVAMLLAALMAAVMAVQPAQAHPSTFPDVPESNVAHDAIETLTGRGVVSGSADGLFQPGAPLTRGQAAKILVGWRQVDTVWPPAAPFADVGADYLEYVTTASALGWVRGYPDGTFRAYTSITREQMAVMVIRSLDLESRARSLTESQIESALSPFADGTDISADARPYTALATMFGLFSGDAGSLNPTKVATRAQFCLVLSRAEALDGAALSGNGHVDTTVEQSVDAPAPLEAERQALAAFMDEHLFRPHSSPVTGEMVLHNAVWYGIPPLAQLVIMGAETSLGDPDLGGVLARNNNFGCMRYHGADTPWGLLSNGRIWVAGLDWYSFPTPEIGMAAWGRYLKTGAHGVYLSVLTPPEPDWYGFAAVYYGEGVSGFGSYVSRLGALEERFRRMAAEQGVGF